MSREQPWCKVQSPPLSALACTPGCWGQIFMATAVSSVSTPYACSKGIITTFSQAGLCCLEMMEKAGLANQLNTHPGWGWGLRPAPAHPANPSFTRWSTASPAAVPGGPSWYPAPLQHPAVPSALNWLCTHQHLSVTVQLMYNRLSFPRACLPHSLLSGSPHQPTSYPASSRQGPKTALQLACSWGTAPLGHMVLHSLLQVCTSQMLTGVLVSSH